MSAAGILSRSVRGARTLTWGRLETQRRPAHVAASTACALYLPAAAPSLGTSGVIIGRELYSGKGYIYDPFTLYGVALPGPNILVQGETGTGKSAWLKSFAARQVRFGRQVAVFSTKPQQDADEQDEWAAVTRAVGGVVVSFRPGGLGSRINPLDPAIPAHLQLWLVRTMVETSSARLTERAQYALKEARRCAVTAAGRGRRVATLSDVAAALLNPAEKAAVYAFPDFPPAEAVARTGPAVRPGRGPRRDGRRADGYPADQGRVAAR